jgi:RimJ/RimL family protein N-acetyltransferase
MPLLFEELSPGEGETLARWLSSEVWPYHVRTQPIFEEVLAQFEAGEFTGEENRAFWAVLDGEKAGLVRFEYLSDPSPTTDFRVLGPYRSRGIGERMVRWAADHLFTTMSGKPRLEGQTRADNLAMRRVFEKCGWVKEAHYRKSWPAGDGCYVDSVGYAILGEDWAEGKITPVDWSEK